MEWISIKDKLPKDFPDICEFDYVFLYADEPEFPSYLFAIGQYRDGKWEILGNEGAHSCTGFYTMTSEMVTHWAHFEFPECEE